MVAAPSRHGLLLAVLVERRAVDSGAEDEVRPSGAPPGTGLAVPGPHQLRAQLTSLGANPVGPVDLSELPGLLDGATPRPVVLLDARAVASDHALRMLVRDDRDDTTVLPDTVASDGTPVGARLSSRVTARLTSLPAGVTIEKLVASIGRHSELTRRTLAPGLLVAAVPTDPAASVAITAAIAATQAAGGEEAIRLRQSTKRLDNPVASHLVGPWSRYLGRWLVGRRVSPDAVTVASLLLALIASLTVCLGNRTGYLLGSIGILASFALDCTDGQMARYGVTYSSVGSWLDGFGDRVKEQMFLAALAIGGVRSALPDDSGRHVTTLWWLAAAAGAVTLIRHLVGFGYVHALGLPSAPPVPDGELSVGQRLRFDLRKIAMLPFGERTLLVCVLAVVSGPRLAFWGLIVLGGLSTLGMFAGRLRRTFAATRSGPTSSAAEAVSLLADVGPLASAVRTWLHRLAFRSVPGALLLAVLPVVAALAVVVVPVLRNADPGVALAAILLPAAALWWAFLGAPLAVRPRGWLSWLVPAVTATVEAAVVLTATFAVRSEANHPLLLGAATFVLLACVALHRYDREYALGLAGSDAVTSRTGRASTMSALGHEGRLVAVAVLASIGLLVSAEVPAVGVWIIAGLVALSVIVASADELRAAVRVRRARG